MNSPAPIPRDHLRGGSHLAPVKNDATALGIGSDKLSSGAPEKSGDSISKGKVSIHSHHFPLGRGNHLGEHHRPADSCQ